MKMSDEHVGDGAKSKPGLNSRFESAIPKVDKIRPTVDDHGV
jgi:hypothetical protein